MFGSSQPQARFDEALEEVRRARELDPLSLLYNAFVGSVLLSAGREDEGVAELKRVVEMDPNFPLAHFLLAYAFMMKRMFPEALQEYKKFGELAGDPIATLSYPAIVHAAAGRRDEALRILDELKARSKREWVSAASYPWAYGLLGERDQAFYWLDRMYEERNPFLIFLKTDRILAPAIGSDPRYPALLRRIGLVK